jgi:lipopolysaccharide export system permease protein
MTFFRSRRKSSKALKSIDEVALAVLKTLDILVLRSFLRPFIPTFLVMIFFFLMQMVWKYIDDLAGRGIEWYYILELLFYWSASVFPFALPISILLSSLMTFGTFGENNELAAMKSAGIPLYRIMRPLVVLMIFVSIGAFFFYNNVIPVANLKSASLIENISKKKPAFNIRQGIFYNGIDGYSIKIGHKGGPDGNELENIMIYDHTDNEGNIKVTLAKSGKMQITEDERYLEITLRDGYTYEEIQTSTRKDRDKHPFVKARFDEALIRFNLMQFQTTNLREETAKNWYMMNVNQLLENADSVKNSLERRKNAFSENFKGKYYFELVEMDSANASALSTNVLANFNQTMSERAVKNALRMARSNIEYINQVISQYEYREKIEARHYLEWHKKFALSFACFVLFFIGAPLGAIIRKGGMGAPVVFSFVIFIIYHILNTTFEKTGRELVLEPWAAIWFGTLILAPFGILLTLSAANDSSILRSEFYGNIVRFVSNPFKRKKKPKTHEDTATVQ